MCGHVMLIGETWNARTILVGKSFGNRLRQRQRDNIVMDCRVATVGSTTLAAMIIISSFTSPHSSLFPVSLLISLGFMYPFLHSSIFFFCSHSLSFIHHFSLNAFIDLFILSFLLSLIRLGSRLNPPRYHKASVACPS